MSRRFQFSTKAKRFMLEWVLPLAMVLNGGIFIAVTTTLGGAVATGKIEGERFFVGQHGHYTEVSKTTYIYCLWYERAFIASMILGMLAGLILNDRLNSAEPGGRKPPPHPRR